MDDAQDLFAAPPKLTQMSSGWKYCLGGDQYGRCFWDASEATSYWLSEYVNKKAEKVRQQLTIDRYQIEQTSILPIYSGVDNARGIYLKHVDAWIEYLEEFSSCMDYAKCVENTKVNNVTPTFLIAKGAFFKASWMTDAQNVEKRIQEIFENQTTACLHQYL